MIEFSQERLEHFCPTFISPEPHTFNAIVPFLESLYNNEFKDDNFHSLPYWHKVEAAYTKEIEAYLYAAACAMAIPHLDLIATDNGFGVVSNEHIAPASPHRVKALLESLRRQKALAWSDLYEKALNIDEWRDGRDARTIYSLLIPSPRVAEDFGIIGHDDVPTSMHHYFKRKSYIEVAQMQLQKIISPELVNTLCLMQRKCCEFSERKAVAYDMLLHKSRQFIAAYLLRGYPKQTNVIGRGILAFIHEQGEAVFTEFFHSTTHKSHTLSLTHPDNAKSPNAYFF